MDSEPLSTRATGQDDDLVKRLTELRLFFSSRTFTKDEYRYMKIVLSKINVDIIGDLPLEMVRQISQLLDLHEFVLCLAVSKPWRSRLLSSAVLRTITDRFCPSLTHSSNQYDPVVFLDALHRIGRSRWGCFQAALAKEFSWEHESYFKLDPMCHDNNHNVSAVYAQFGHYHDDPEPYDQAYTNALYSHGRIAWLAKPRVVVVDNLWTRTRKIFNRPTGPLSGPKLQILALGDRLVVGTVHGLIVAWDHVTNMYLEKRLPSPVKYATTEGLRVAMVLFNGDTFLWNFSSRLLMLATGPLKQSLGLDEQQLKSWVSNLRVFFHPTCGGTLLLASGYTDPRPGDSRAVLKRIVYEFKDMNHTDTLTFEVPTSIQKHDSPANIKVDIQKVLPYRRDIIGFCERQYRPLAQRVTPYKYDNFVEFDIYERQFRARTGEEFDPEEFGWRKPLEDADLDFQVKFYCNGFSVVSYRPGFEFGIGE
ncbi:hypothetical protein Daesc_003378 [Daldinia eschscholtzii]|uniref:F-box domain-containing protein n=1 Tax=Daldinia eschscholtzii TaxID=292717 RepID=A0AAX6MSY9_9PEZI